MSFIHFEFFKSYYYFIIYWALDLSNSMEKEYFESSYNNNTNNNFIY